MKPASVWAQPNLLRFISTRMLIVTAIQVQAVALGWFPVGGITDSGSDATGFANDDGARARVPRVQISFVVPVVVSPRNETQIEGR